MCPHATPYTCLPNYCISSSNAGAPCSEPHHMLHTHNIWSHRVQISNQMCTPTIPSWPRPLHIPNLKIQTYLPHSKILITVSLHKSRKLYACWKNDNHQTFIIVWTNVVNTHHPSPKESCVADAHHSKALCFSKARETEARQQTTKMREQERKDIDIGERQHVNTLDLPQWMSRMVKRLGMHPEKAWYPIKYLKKKRAGQGWH